jgi:hypothetical protein
MRTLIFLLTLCLAAPAARADAPPTTPESDAAWKVMIDPAATTVQRHAAEDQLATAPPVFLPILFAALDDRINGKDPVSLIAMTPGYPVREFELTGFPAEPQVAYARIRLWQHLSRNAEPAEERRRVLASLFPLAESHQQKLKLLQSISTQNWSPEIEQAVSVWFLDRSQPYDVRQFAARSLVNREHKRWRETVLQEAWLMRDESLEGALRIASTATPIAGDRRFPYDPRYAALIADNFDRVRKTQPNMSAASAATTLGNYLKVKFTPALDSPIVWQSEEWYAAIVENTSLWLGAHEAELNADALRAAQGEKVENRFKQPDFVSEREEEAVRAKKRNLRRVRELQGKD